MKIRGLTYHIEEYGAKTNPPLLMLHGFTGNTTNWHPFIPQLEKDYRLILVDLPGHGQTDMTENPEDYKFSFVCQNLQTLLDNLDAAPAHVLGYSMGGRMALAFALMANRKKYVRSLMLESASPGIRDSDERNARRDKDNALADRILENGIASFVNDWEKLPLWETQNHLAPEILQAQREQRLSNNPIGLAHSLRGMGTGVQHSLWRILYFLDIPALFIAGDEDEKYSLIAEAMHLRISDSETAIIPGAGHNIHLEQPDTFINRILYFLKMQGEENA